MPFPHTLRHFYEDEDLKTDRILVTGSTITLGPLVSKPQSVVYYIEALLKEASLRGPRIEISKIPFQETSQ